MAVGELHIEQTSYWGAAEPGEIFKAEKIFLSCNKQPETVLRYVQHLSFGNVVANCLEFHFAFHELPC